MIPQFKDVVTRYQPAIIFSDGEWDLPSPGLEERGTAGLALQRIAVQGRGRRQRPLGQRDCRHKHGGYWTTEYAAGMKDAIHPWEESRGMGYSYGYNRAERIDDYKTGRELVIMLVRLW